MGINGMSTLSLELSPIRAGLYAPLPPAWARHEPPMRRDVTICLSSYVGLFDTAPEP
jgi:hypothetical protein